jgi:hypothetical protein
VEELAGRRGWVYPLRDEQISLALAFLISATSLEASGDAIVRKGLFEDAGIARVLSLLAGGVLLLVLGYGVMLNLAPLPFERVVGLYIAGEPTWRLEN